jgi:hypothetical protein
VLSLKGEWMKVIGILRVRNEADLLEEVLDNVSKGVDEIYAYDDDSTDGTLAILEAHPSVTYIEPFDPTFTAEFQKTRLLEQRVKERYPEYQTEEVWVALLAGDLFWLNMNATDAANLALSKGCDLQNGVVVDFGRWEWDETTDTWPNYPKSLREMCQWCAIIEELPVVWKVSDYTRWKRLPWPGEFKRRNVSKDASFPFLEHQGKRSPKYHQWKYATDSRAQPRVNGKRTTAVDWNDAEFSLNHGKSLGFWENDRRIPWEGLHTIDRLMELENMTWPDRVAVYRTYDDKRHDNWPRRTDI